MIVTWTQVLIIIHLFYQVIVNQFYVKAKILKKNRRTISEICSFKHKHPQTRNCQYGKWPCVPCKRYSQDQRLIRTRSTFSKSVIVSVGVSALGFTELIFTEPGVKISMVNFIETKVISDHIGSVRSLYLTMFQAIGAIGIVYELAPPSLEDLTHLAVSGLVDSLNEV